MIGQRRIAELDKDLGIQLRSVVVLDIKLGFKLGTVLYRRRRTEVVLDIKVGSKLGAGLDREDLIRNLVLV
jgi:hypothetical protein